ncbi:MAG TPA: efflux RND transporter periplasmic adaptor subunit [Verrucomicrobiae bacterium]
MMNLASMLKKLGVFMLGLLLTNSPCPIAATATNLSLKQTKLANTIVLDAIAVKNLRIETVTATEQNFHETIFALGTLEVRPGFSAVLSSRIPGRALQVMAQHDHEVGKDEPLVIVESRQPGDPPPTVTLSAPISGIVSEISIERGEPISPDEALLRIVDLSSVYGIARIPAVHASKLQQGLKTIVRVPGFPDVEWPTRLEHLGARADAASGTVEAAFYIQNADLKLRPGMRAEFSIVTGSRENVMSVPRSALQGDSAQRFLFVADESVPHAFIKVPVQVGAINDQFAEIIVGLFPGDRVVTQGAYSLAFAGKGTVSLKEALDAAHGHEHNPDGSEITAQQKAARASARPGATERSQFSPLTIFSLGANVVLLILLALAAKRRKEISTDS